jgi:hypothetical protein
LPHQKCHGINTLQAGFSEIGAKFACSFLVVEPLIEKSASKIFMDNKNSSQEQVGESVTTSKTQVNQVLERLQVNQSELAAELSADFDDAVEQAYGNGEEENEFAAPLSAHVSVGAKTGSGPGDGDDLSAFDPANFVVARAEQIVAAMPARKVTRMALRRPSNKEYVRVHPDEEFRMSPVYLLTWKKEDREMQYIILGKCVPEVIGRAGETVKPFTIVTAVSNSGSPFLWPVRVLGDDESNGWLESAQQAQLAAKEGWVRVMSDRSAGEYYVQEPQSKLPDPKWPTEPFTKLLKLAFGKRVIDSVDHPAVNQVLGIL